MDNSSKARARMSANGWEFEFEGPADFVDKQVSKTFGMAGEPHIIEGRSKTHPHQPMLFPESVAETKDDTSNLLAEGDVSSTELKQDDDSQVDLVEGYLQISPKSRPDEILFIAYVYQVYQEYEFLTTKNFSEAYEKLRYAGAEFPDRLDSCITQTLNKYPKFFKILERGKYIITLPGRKYIKEKLGY